MRTAAILLPDVVGQASRIGAGSAFELEFDLLPFDTKELEGFYPHLFRRILHSDSLPGVGIQRFAENLLGGVWWNCLPDRTGVFCCDITQPLLVERRPKIVR